jgi:hypothetical protein
MRRLLALALVLATAAVAAAQSPDKLARAYADAIRELNEKHAKSPGNTQESELAKKLPAGARKALDELLAAKKEYQLAGALELAAEAAVDLDLVADFDRIRERVAQVAPARESALGRILSRPRFVLRGIALDEAYCERFADVLDAVLDTYHDEFGFTQWSKVPGKKLRVRLHLEPGNETSPPHFAPQFPFHSEIDFPVGNPTAFKSPTGDGKFLFYGLCHELGHVIAMWGNRDGEQDHHAWAHYTGVAIVEALSKNSKHARLLEDLRDVQWRSLSKEREAAKSVKPWLDSREGVLAVLIALHDEVGSRAIGEAINALDAKDQRLRINRVRYYTFAELKQALLDVVKDDAARKQIKALLP